MKSKVETARRNWSAKETDTSAIRPEASTIRPVKKMRAPGLLANKMAAIGMLAVILLAIAALASPFLAPHDPYEQNLDKILTAPGGEYPFGTDELGRCILSRVIYGSRNALFIGLVVTAISAGVGLLVGLLSGFYGGFVDEGLMRLVDVLLAFPGLVLALALAGLMGPGLFNLMLALALVGWMGYARVVRGTVLSVKEEDFVESARAAGAGKLYIMRRHLLPNVLAPVIVMATLGVGHVILNAAALCFLGLGLQPPEAVWGAMLANGKSFIRQAPHLAVFPGLAIMVSVLAFNFLGDGLRDALVPAGQARELE